MNGLTQLPELPIDATCATCATSTASSEPTAARGDGGAFDRLIASERETAPPETPKPPDAIPTTATNIVHADSAATDAPSARRGDPAQADAHHTATDGLIDPALGDIVGATITPPPTDQSTNQTTISSTDTHSRSTEDISHALAIGSLLAGHSGTPLGPLALSGGSTRLTMVPDPNDKTSKSTGESVQPAGRAPATGSAPTGPASTGDHPVHRSGDSITTASVGETGGSLGAGKTHAGSWRPGEDGGFGDTDSVGPVDRRAPEPTGAETLGTTPGRSDRNDGAIPKTSKDDPIASGEHLAAGAPASPSPVAPAVLRPAPAHAGELPGVTSQLLNVISPLRQAPSGTQTLTVALHPAGLGEVRVSMTVTNDQTTIRLVASTPEGADAIRASLGSLESGLSDGHQQAHVFLEGDMAGGAQQNPGGGPAHDGHPSNLGSDSRSASSPRTDLAPPTTPDLSGTETSTRLINMRI